MSLCINPRCLEPDHPGNDTSRFCQSCGSDLVLQDRYRVMRLISNKSGFGNVYEAYERSTPKILKILKDIHSNNPKAVKLFEREAIVLSQLHHPGVPKVEADGYFQVSPRDGEALHCIIMEKIDGPNLREWMRQQGYHPISEQQALKWLTQLTEVLHLVHQQNYFHRDIKPENIMLRPNGQVVLVDFGAAREMTYTYLAHLGGSEGVTRISSAGYTPPEQEKGQAVPQSDFYALGWTLIYLMTAKQPTSPEIYDPLKDEYHWRQFAPHISSEFADFIDRLIAPKASDRPKNTEEILLRLNQLVQMPVKPEAIARITTNNAIAAGKQPLTLPQMETVAQTSSLRGLQIRQNRWLLGGLTALVLGMGGLGGWALYQTWGGGAIASQPLTVAGTLKEHTGFINHIIFSQDGKTVISGGADHLIIVWDLATQKPLRVLKGHTAYVNALALSNDGQTLVSGGADKKIIIWDLNTGQSRYILQGHTNAVNTLVIGSDGTLVSGSADRTLRTWDLATGKLLHTLNGHSGFINTVAISTDARLLASGGTDNTVIIWDLATGQERSRFNGYKGNINALVFNPDTSTLIGGSTDRNIYIWDVNTGELLHTLQGHEGYVNSLAIRGDGKRLLSSDAQGNLILWDLEQATELKHFFFNGEGARLDHFAVSPDWKAIATGRGFDTVKLWQLPPTE